MKNIFKYLIVSGITLFVSPFLYGQSSLINLTGKVSGIRIHANSTIKINVFKHYFSSLPTDFKTVITCPLNEKGEFKVDVNAPAQNCYLEFILPLDTVNIKAAEMTKVFFYKPYLFQQGDSIDIDINILRETVKFKGKGYEKLECQYLINCTQFPNGISSLVVNLANRKEYYQSFTLERKMYDLLMNFKIAALNSFKEKLSDSIYHSLYVNMLSEQNYKILDLFKVMSSISTGERLAALKAVFKDQYAYTDTIKENVVYLTNSSFYTDWLFQKERLQLEFNQDSAFSFKDIYNQIKYKYTGTLRDRLILTCFWEMSRNREQESFKYITDAMSLVQNKAYREMLKKWYEHQSTGIAVYGFDFKDTFDKVYPLKDFKGKIVVLDFWYYGCFGCTQMPEALEKVMLYFQNRSDIIYVSVNIDKNKVDWLDGLKRGIYTSTGQLNLNTGKKGKDHPLITYYNYYSFPRIMVIGKHGELISANPPDPRSDEGAGLISLIKGKL